MSETATANPVVRAWDALRRKRIQTLAFLAMGVIYFASFFQRVGIPGTVFNEIQADLKLSASAVAGLGAIFFYIYAGMQLVVGVAADRLGGSKVLLGGGLVMCVGAVLFPFSPDIGMLYGTRAMIGFGASFIYLAYVKETDALFGAKHFAALMGPVYFMGQVGGLAGTLPLERAVAAWGWRKALFLSGLVPVAALVLAAILLRRLRDHTSRGQPFVWARVTGVLRTPGYLPFVISGSSVFAVYFVIQSTLGKKFLQDFAGLSSGQAASFTFVMMLIGMSVGLVAGLLPGLVGHRRWPFVMLARVWALVAAGLLLYGVKAGSGAGTFLAAYVLLAASSALAPVGLALVKDLARPESLGLALSICNFAVYAAVAGRTPRRGGLKSPLLMKQQVECADRLAARPRALDGELLVGQTVSALS
jgi:predicted MFS family arabinose efflux permease